MEQQHAFTFLGRQKNDSRCLERPAETL